MSLKQLVSQQLLTIEESYFLENVRLYNPLLFDFALKRLLRFEGKSFPAKVFETNAFFMDFAS